MKTIAVIGSNGDLGTILSQYLTAHGYRILRVARCYENIPFNERAKYCYTIEDLLTNVSGTGIDFCINTVCCYGRNGERFIDVFDANIQFGLDIYKYCVNKSINFINIGTVLPKDVSVYALSKNIFQEILEKSNEKIFTMNLNLDIFYGPCLKGQDFISRFINNLSFGIPIPLTLGKHPRDFTYVLDVCSAIQFVIENSKIIEENGKSFSLSSNTAVRVKDFLLELKSQYEKECGAPAGELEFGKVTMRDGEEIMNVYRPLTDFGWSKSFDYKRGIDLTIRGLMKT